MHWDKKGILFTTFFCHWTMYFSSGSVGDAISVMKSDVYVSDDGGYTWIKALSGPHHYAILDSGGLLVAVEHSPKQPVNQIK